jgi:hypothetical protein
MSMQTKSFSLAGFRLYGLVCASTLAVATIWLLAPEILRPSLPYFPTAQAEIDSTTPQKESAASAARLGWPRGNLWVDYALTENAELLSGFASGATSSAERDTSVSAAAASLAPYDPRPWLLLAMTNGPQTAAQLKMSFYTAPNDLRLIPARLRIVARSASLGDEELRSLFEHDLRTVVTHAPNLRSSIVAAYLAGSAVGREFIEATLKSVDAELLAELRRKH